jgi:hypothetical protein
MMIDYTLSVGVNRRISLMYKVLTQVEREMSFDSCIVLGVQSALWRKTTGEKTPQQGYFRGYQVRVLLSKSSRTCVQCGGDDSWSKEYFEREDEQKGKGKDTTLWWIFKFLGKTVTRTMINTLHHGRPFRVHDDISSQGRSLTKELDLLI